MSDKLLNPEELAAILRLAPSTVRADVCRRPHTLPPRFKRPGSNRLLWRESDVYAWLEEHTPGRLAKKTPQEKWKVSFPASR